MIVRAVDVFPIINQANKISDGKAAQIIRLKQLQGQCKIIDYQLLQINYPKMVFFIMLMAITVIGLLLLKYFTKLRVYLFYNTLGNNEADSATHIYVQGSENHETICDMERVYLKGKEKKVFTFINLRYQYTDRDYLPLSLKYIEQIGNYSNQYLRKGLSDDDVAQRRDVFGRNQHKVQIPNYFIFIFDTMTQPLYIFQYVICFIWIIQNQALFGILMVVLSFITTSVNYILLYRSYGKIKETADKLYQILAFRQGKFIRINNTELVCGDLYLPEGEIPCDSILLNGDLFVDQSNLTGQTVPIPKFKLSDPSQVQQKNHWFFQGSLVKTRREGSLALAVNIGFASNRGRIIRKILTKKAKQPDLIKKLMYFLIQIGIAGILLYISTFYLMFEIEIETIMIIFRLLTFITMCFPAQLPIFFNLAYSFCLVRLNRAGIYGTQSEKTVEGSRIKTICFDKTGTLTQSQMKIANIFNFQQNNIIDVTINAEKYQSIKDIFACCNSVEQINGSYEGDIIDLKMFQLFKANILKSNQKAHRIIQIDNEQYQILKINEYQSQFQSMSVLFRNSRTKTAYVAAKGSPQMIHLYSQRKIDRFDNLIKKLSLQGFRSIAFGIRKVDERQYISADRVNFLKSIDIIGLVTFTNLLKQDARQTIQTLYESDISTKIITGDNIFLGVQTAMMTGMIPNQVATIVLQGAKCRGKRYEITILTKNSNGQIFQEQKSIQNFQFQSKLTIAYAVDNDYIKQNSNFLHNRVIVFARITPENKALIVRKHKQLIQIQFSQLNCWKKIFVQNPTKVGMVGDGANDLIAIKDADIGIGISDSDAVFSASFAVKELHQIIKILCESKSTQREIVQMAQYYLIINFLSIVATIILTSDASSDTSLEIIYKNFLVNIPITVSFAFSSPSTTLSKFMPNSNFMGKQNHLVFWVSVMIMTAGQTAAYFIYYNSSEFIPNPKPIVTISTGFNGECQSSTVNFLVSTLLFSFFPVIIYRSSPWKQAIYKNIALTIIVIINVGLIITIYFMTGTFGFIGLQAISLKYSMIIMAITLATLIITWLANYFIQNKKMHEAITCSGQVNSQFQENQNNLTQYPFQDTK